LNRLAKLVSPPRGAPVGLRGLAVFKVDLHHLAIAMPHSRSESSAPIISEPTLFAGLWRSEEPSRA